MIDLGAAYPVAVDLFDESGNRANAVSVTVTITQPDGTQATPELANPPSVEGQYRGLYPTTQAGRHVVRVVTSSPDTAYTDVFDVGEAVPPSIVSLWDAKEFLGIDQQDSSQDRELRAWLAGTTQVVERLMNEVIAKRQITFTEKNENIRKWRLWHVPVISLDSLARWDGTYTWNVTTDVYTDPETGIIELIRGPSLRHRLTAVFTAGYQVVPYHYQQGSLVLLQHAWETQRGPGGVGGGVVGPEEAGDMKQMYMVPRKVREWLGEPRPVVA